MDKRFPGLLAIGIMDLVSGACVIVFSVISFSSLRYVVIISTVLGLLLGFGLIMLGLATFRRLPAARAWNLIFAVVSIVAFLAALNSMRSVVTWWLQLVYFCWVLYYLLRVKGKELFKKR